MKLAYLHVACVAAAAGRPRPYFPDRSLTERSRRRSASPPREASRNEAGQHFCVKAPDSTGGSSAGTKESPWHLCTPAEVEQVKLLLCVVPIFACTIVFNTVLAQLQTFSVQQGSAMDTRLAASGFHVPPASLQAIPYIMLVALVPAYEAAFVPAMRRLTGVATGITPLQRIGVGLFAVTFSMVAAALVEARQRRHAADGGRLLSIFWIAPRTVGMEKSIDDGEGLARTGEDRSRARERNVEARKLRYGVYAARGDIRVRCRCLASWEIYQVNLRSCWRCVFVFFSK